MSNLIGQSLGRYHILEQLGEGGMAAVYKAFDTRLERNVAIKVILPGKQHSEKFLKRFEREAKALAGLSHPNIVGVIDYGEQDGMPYLVMEYLPGGTLKHKLSGKPMPWQEATRLLIPIARALAYANENKIIHRDVKPSNILITQSGEPMLSDFGIAKILEVEETLDLTGTGVGVGTPEYMSPEQAQGKQVDARSDIYSLGVVFYEMVTGRKPYQADTPYAVVIKQVTEPLPRPSGFVSNLPNFVEQILLKTLAKNPANRYQNMSEYLSALERCAWNENATVKKKRTTSGESSVLTGKKYLIFLVIGGFLLFGGGLLLGNGWLREFIQTTNKTNSLPVVTAITSRSQPLPSTTQVLTHVPTQTIRPATATPVRSPTSLNSQSTSGLTQILTQTNVPISSNKSGQPNIYDDFDNPLNDGSYDKSLWKILYGTLPKPIQDNGYLTFSETGVATSNHEIALQANAIGVVSLSDLDYIQADLAIGGDANSRFSHVAINIVAMGTPKGDFWIEADLMNSSNHPSLLCRIAYFGKKESFEYNKTISEGLKYNEFYTIRIQLDPITSLVRWYVNDTLVCDFTSKEYAENNERSIVVILNSNRANGSFMTNYVDNFIIVK